MLVKSCVCGVYSTLKLKSKITVVNNDLSLADFLKTTLGASRKRIFQLIENVHPICKPCKEVKKKIAVLKGKRKNVTSEKDD